MQQKMKSLNGSTDVQYENETKALAREFYDQMGPKSFYETFYPKRKDIMINVLLLF